MAEATDTRTSWTSWTTLTPVLAMIVLAVSWGRYPNTVIALLIGVFLVGAVLAAVHHAEVVAHRVGEPFGSLILAVAVTVIEVALIVTLMVSGEKDTSGLARDTVFAAVMISVNGIVGVSLVVGALRQRNPNALAVFNAEGSGSALATVATLATLTLVLPRFTTSEAGPEFSPASSRSPPWRRCCSTPCSCSRRPSSTGTSSCRSSTVTTDSPTTTTTVTPTRRPPGRR